MSVRRQPCPELEEDGAALALDALEPVEREALEVHAQRCADCARELAELSAIAAQLALSLPQVDPPRALGQRILAAAERDRLLASRAQAEPGPSHLLRAQPIAAGPAWLQRLAPLLSLASLVVAVIALVWGVTLQAQLSGARLQLQDTTAQLDRLRGNYYAVASVLASPQMVVHELQTDPPAAGAACKIWVDPASGRGMLMARNLPPLPAERTYQVWLSNGSGRVTGGFLRPNDEGVYYVVLRPPGRLTDYQGLGVTVEPDGGSPAPTGQRVISGEI
jgi:hypothetical protein